MKKTILLFSFIAAVAGASAQTTFGIQAGATLSKANAFDSGTITKPEYKMKAGFLVGFVANVPLTTSLSFRPELNFVQKGGKFSQTSTVSFGGNTITSAFTNDVTLNYIELPLNLSYSVPAGSNKVFFGAGPTFGYGISGNSKWKNTQTSMIGSNTTITNTSGTDKFKFDGKKDSELPVTDTLYHLKALDLGLNVFAGFQMSKNIFLNVGYTFGLNNINPNPGAEWKNSVISFKIGYMFGGGAKPTVVETK